GRRVFCHLSPVKKDLTPEVESLVNDHKEPGRLNKLPWRWSGVDAGHALGQAMRGLIFIRMRPGLALVEERFRPGLERNIAGLQVGSEILHILVAVGFPNTRQFRLAVGQSWRGS